MKISDLKVGYTDKKRNSEKIDLWLYHFARPFSWPLTWLCITLGLSASAVTYISIVAVIVGAICLILGNYTITIVGILLFNFWVILDCVDGNIARYKKTFSQYGEFIDAVGGYFATTFLFSSLGYLSYRLFDDPNYLILGFWATISSLFSRLLYQKFKNTFTDTDTVIKPRDNSSSFPMMVAQNIGAASGLVLPISVIAVILHKPNYIVIVWAGINTLMLFYTFVKTLKVR
ncbi:MAG: CDP-alcohol phosphatidyltransferase family protein [Spirochaetaceae bacterium]